MEKTMLDCLDRLTDWDARQRRKLAYLYRMGEEHPTRAGRKRAMKQWRDLNNYIEDVHGAWQSIRLALWPSREESNAVD